MEAMAKCQRVRAGSELTPADLLVGVMVLIAFIFACFATLDHQGSKRRRVRIKITLGPPSFDIEIEDGPD